MAQNVQAINVGINAQGAQQGARQVNQSLQSMQRQILMLAAAMGKINAAAGRGGGGGIGGGGVAAAVGGGGPGGGIPAATNNLKEFMTLLNRMRNTLFVLYLAREAFDGITSAIRSAIVAGIDFNAKMEQAVIGVGGLISQLATLELRGVKLEGIDSIRAGMELAKDQVLQLQIAGLQTAATTEALVNAFQQAVGPGLAAGLALEQVRDLTVDIVQVATSIGLPMHQIAQEVRAIVEGTIDPNARVAKILNLKNSDIQKMKEAGTLAEFLFDKLNKFREIGPIIEESFAGAASNVQELTQVLSGLATKPLFDQIRDSMVEFNKALREGGAGKDAKALKDVFAVDLQEGMESLGEVFKALGRNADRVFDTIVDRARDMLNAFTGSPEAIDSVTGSIDLLGDAIVHVLEEIDIQGLMEDVISAFRDLAEVANELADAFNFLGSTIKFLQGGLQAVHGPSLRQADAMGAWLDVLLLNITPMEAWAKTLAAMDGAINDVTSGLGKMDEAMRGVDAARIETQFDRIQQALGHTKPYIDALRESITGMNNEWDKFLDFKVPTSFKDKVRQAPFGATVFDIEGGKTYDEMQRDINLRHPPKPTPDPDKLKRAAEKAAREAERAAAKERAFQLAKLQLIEQTARDEVDTLDKYNKIALDQLDAKHAAGLLSQKEFIEKRLRLEIQGAEDEEKLALLRAQNTINAGKKALGGLLPADTQALLTSGVEGLDALQKALKDAIPVVKTQEQAEALRETTQAVKGLADARLKLAEVSGAFLVRALPLGPLPEPVELAEEPDSVRRRIIAGTGAKSRAREKALLEDELAIQTALTHGQITQAEASERLADAAERRNKFEIDILEAERAGLDPATKQLEIHQKTLEIMEKEAQVFRVSNADAFFKGLNENIDKLSDKFQQLGEDIRGIFKDAFEELGRTGFRGFIDTFLSGIADALNTRAADALSQIVTKILTDIFKPGGGGQSIFDKLIEQLMSIFGRKPTGSFSIGGVLEKIFGKLLDPLGRKKQGDLPIQGAPKGLPEILEDVRRASTPEAQTLSTLATLNTEVGGIHRDTMDIAQSLRELKQCCAEHNSLLKQQMANAAKGPSLLGQILSAAAGAAIGGYIGGIGTGSGDLTGVYSEGDLPIAPSPDWSTIPGTIPPGYSPAAPGGSIRYNDPFSNLASVTTNITIQTPNPAAFNAPQTQAQIGSLVFNNIQKAQTLVPAITNPKP